MTTTLDRPTETAPHVAAAPPRPSSWARWRVAARLARRQLRRTRVSSLLVATLVALPIAGMTAFIVFAASQLPTPYEKVRVELGQMQAWIAPLGIPGEGFWQAPAQPAMNGYPIDADGSMTIPAGAPLDDPTASLPTGTETILIAHGTATVETRAGLATVVAWAGDSWNPHFAGVFDLVAGKRPDTPREAMTTPATLDRLGVEIGGELRVDGAAQAYTIVGTMDAATLPDHEAAVFLPGTAHDLVGGDRRWYLPDRALTWADVQTLNEDGVAAFSRDVVLDPPTFTNAYVRSGQLDSWDAMWPLILTLAAAGLFAGYVVVMLAGAAFAVAARRQQRSLAVAASVGADRRDLSRTILLQGTGLGFAGGAAGIAAGVGLAAAVMGLTADGRATQFWGFHVPWPVLGGILVFAVVVGTVSSAMPARTVARSDPLQALRGARRPQKPTASRPVWGSILLVAGVALTITCALAVAAINATNAFPWDSPMRIIPPFGIVVGPILAQFGILLSGRWLLWTSSRALSHVGMAAKLASRDAAANASRTVPAFAAIAATVFIGVFAVGQASMQSAQSARIWYYDAPLGSLAINIWATQPSTTGVLAPEDARAGATAAVRLAEDAGAQLPSIIERQQHLAWSYQSADDVPDDLTFTLAILPEQHLIDPEAQDSWVSMGQDPRNPISVIRAEDLTTVLGVDISAHDLAAYRAGAAIVADERFVTDDTIDVATFSGAAVYEGAVPDNIWLRGPDWPELADPMRAERVDAIVIDAPLQPVTIAIAPATADRLGIASQPDRVVAAFDAAPSIDDRDRLQAQAELSGTTEYTLVPGVEDGPPSDAAWMVPLLAAVSVLVLGASAVALGLARFERRPDDATLAAVGGTRALRRGIGFWQGLIIAGFGTVAGAAAGILPPIGFAIQSQGTQRLDDIPWGVIGAVVLALPLAIAVTNWIVPPRHPDLTRRTAIA